MGGERDGRGPHLTDLASATPVIIEPEVFRDERGFFYEAFNQGRFEDQVGYSVDFVQDNHSRSKKGVLRGLHYQLPPAEQGKLISVTRGTIYDVAVDIRRSSSDFGRWVGVEISEDRFHQFWVPPGFAHGFLVLSEVADVVYKTTSYYAPEHDHSIRWDDPDLGIDWPLDDKPIVAAKDASAPSLADAEVFD